MLTQVQMENVLKKYVLKQPGKLLSAVLCLVALHSFLMGLILIFQPAFLMKFAGFSLQSERFFPTQGGVFHILMAVAYTMGAVDAEKYYYLIVFSIIVKAVATLFLLSYCFSVEFKWIFLFCGIGDGVMGAMIFLALQNLRLR